jgi:hypothetical protein
MTVGGWSGIATSTQRARDGGGVAIDTDGMVVNCRIHDNIASNSPAWATAAACAVSTAEPSAGV